MDDFDYEAEAFNAVPARRIDFAIIGIEFAKDIAGIARDTFDAVHEAFDLLSQVACQHANYLVEREKTHAEMALELETILGEAE